jgi:hypothetical protein
MATQTQAQIPTKVYAYTQHVNTVRIIEELCGQRVTLLTQDRTRDPVQDVLMQIPPNEDAVLYAVLPLDKIVELLQKAPRLKIRLMQLDGSVVEKITGRPYDPKMEYSPEVVKAALRIVEVRGGSVRYVAFSEMVDEIAKKGYRRIAVFNDAMREGFRMALQRLGANLELVKACNGDSACVEVNPPGFKSGYRISFPGVAGRLTPEQIADMLFTGARIYYAEVSAEVVPLCS